MARRASVGFSLVELLVALVFTMILMAGMAKVFQSSLSSFYTSGEKLSNIRRNRVALDLVYDDLNTAGMALVDITTPLPASDTNPAFYIIPNVTVTGAGTNDPQTTDELYMAYDQPLAFEGLLQSGGGSGGSSAVGSTAVSKVLTSGSLTAGIGGDDQYQIDCGDPTYANSVKTGMFFQIKDDMSHAAFQIKSVTPPTGNIVTVTVVTNPTLTTQVTGRGDPGTLRPGQRITGSSVVFILPSQMVRYHIAMQKLDPSNANGIPCLVREQGSYVPSAAFTVSTTQIVAENVAGFKVFLSADSGADWAGSALASTTTGFSAGWTSGIQAALNTQIGTIARADYTTTTGNLGWYRDIPVLVRLDITTRTAVQRAEYSSAGNTLAYKNLTQSVVLVPRHFGLPLN